MFEWVGWESLYEVVLRTVLVFFFTYLLMRLRGNKQLMNLTLFDVIIIVALGSAVGDAMIYGEETIPMMHSMTAIFTVIILVLIIENILAIAPKRVFQLVEGKEVILVKDGEVDYDALKKVNLHEEELKSLLRARNIHYYSQVRIAYLEPDGTISVVRKRNGSDKTKD